MVAASESVKQQLVKDDSLNVFIGHILRINQYIQKGLAYHNVDSDHDNALAQMEVFAFLNDWSSKLVENYDKASQGNLSLLKEILEMIEKASPTGLSLLHHIHRKYTEWCQSKSSQDCPETLGSGFPAVFEKSLRKRSSSPDVYQPIKRQIIATYEIEDSDDELVPATDSAAFSSSQSIPDSQTTASQLDTSPDDSQVIEYQSITISEVEESIDNVAEQVPATGSAGSFSSQPIPDSHTTASQLCTSPDDSQEIMAKPEVEDSVDKQVEEQVPATESAVTSNSQSEFGFSPSIEVEFTAEDNMRAMQLFQGPIGEVIVKKFNMTVSRADIITLYGRNWLNDNVINFYMELLNERSKHHAGQLPSVHAMNSYFIKRLMSAGYSAVRRWTRKVDLFSKELIPVPVHFSGQPSHWSMAIIDMRAKTIRFYDSMGLSNTPALMALAAYLEQESMDKRQQPLDTSCFQIENVKEVPRQYNGNDCGVFCCMFAEYLTRDVPLTFNQSHMVALRQKMLLEIADGKLMT